MLNSSTPSSFIFVLNCNCFTHSVYLVLVPNPNTEQSFCLLISLQLQYYIFKTTYWPKAMINKACFRHMYYYLIHNEHNITYIFTKVSFHLYYWVENALKQYMGDHFQPKMHDKSWKLYETLAKVRWRMTQKSCSSKETSNLNTFHL